MPVAVNGSDKLSKSALVKLFKKNGLAGNPWNLEEDELRQQLRDHGLTLRDENETKPKKEEPKKIEKAKKEEPEEEEVEHEEKPARRPYDPRHDWGDVWSVPFAGGRGELSFSVPSTTRMWYTVAANCVDAIKWMIVGASVWSMFGKMVMRLTGNG